MLSVVITGHGEFATGIKSMLDLVLGEVEHAYFINFHSDLSSEMLKEQFQEVYQKTKGNIIFLADIAGGTPFNQAAMVMHEQGQTSGVIGGISIPTILEILDQRESTTDISQLCLLGKSAGIENLKIWGEVIEDNTTPSDDGI